MYWFTNKILILITLIATPFFQGIAQQSHFYSQFNLSSLSINPAYTGSNNLTELMLSYRAQWLKMEGAPKTLSCGIHSSKEASNLGYGILFTQDKIGISSSLWITPSASYSVNINKNYSLNFGLSAGFVQITNDWSSVSTVQTNDPTYIQSSERQTLPSVGTGLYLHSKSAYIGISIPNILENDYNYAYEGSDAKQVRHYFIQGGKIFDLSPQWDFKGELVIKSTVSNIFQYDLRVSAIYAKKALAGINYRHNAAITPNIQFYINKVFNVGYSYDIMINKLNNYQSGTHEIFISYGIAPKNRIIDNPRFF